MNYYNVFYFFSLSDKLSRFFDLFSNIFTTSTIILTIIMIIVMAATKTDGDLKMSNLDTKWFRVIRNTFYLSLISMIIFWFCYILTPTKKEMTLILAGGAIGNFITTDSSARQIPAELTNLVKSELQKAVQENNLDLLKTKTLKDSLSEMTKEQLVEYMLNKKK